MCNRNVNVSKLPTMIPDECAKAFETILHQAGPFGNYQKRLYAVISMMHVVCASVLTYIKFLPLQERRQNCGGLHVPRANSSVLFLAANETLSYPTTCYTYYVNSENLDADWTLPEWTLPEYAAAIRDFLCHCQAAAMIVGCLFGGMMSDYLGRRRVTFVAFTMMCAAQACTAMSQHWVVFAVFQGLVGFSAGCFIPASVVLLAEYVGGDWRDVALCLLPWWLGPSLLSMQAYLVRHWRYLALVSGTLGVPLIGTFFLVLESARWLMVRRRFPAAEGATMQLVSCNCRPVQQIVALFDVARASVLNTMHNKRYTPFHLLQSNGLRKCTISVILCWLIGAMVYCGLLRRVRRLNDDPYINNLVMYSADAVVIMSAVFINKCTGRRWCLFLYAMSSGVISMCILVLHVTNESDVDEAMINMLAFFTKLGVTTSLTLINLVTLEVYPTVIRTMGCSLGFTFCLTGYILADRLIIYLEPFHYTVPFIVYGGMMVVFAGFCLLLPETHGQPLPDILRCRHRNLCSHDGGRLANRSTA